MLNFTGVKDIDNGNIPRKPVELPANAATLKTLTELVVTRFIESVDWDSIVDIYLKGLADDDDLALIKRAVKARAGAFVGN